MNLHDVDKRHSRTGYAVVEMDLGPTGDLGRLAADAAEANKQSVRAGTGGSAGNAGSPIVSHLEGMPDLDLLRAVAGEADAIEAIGDLREPLELEDLLILPVLPLEQRPRSQR
jgi:hypothetical protein